MKKQFEILMTATSKMPVVGRAASAELMKNKSAVPEVCMRSGFAAECASAVLQQNKEVALEAAKQNGLAMGLFSYGTHCPLGRWRANRCRSRGSEEELPCSGVCR